MHIYVKPLKGNTSEIAVSTSHSILDVKNVINLELGVPVGQQKLVYQGKSLLDHKTLEDYSIQEGAKLFLFKKKDSELSAPPQESEKCHRPLSQSEKGAGDMLDSSALWCLLRLFLLRHFTEKDADKVLYHFKKNLDYKIASMSLDDIERLANRKLGLMDSSTYSLTDDRMYVDYMS